MGHFSIANVPLPEGKYQDLHHSNDFLEKTCVSCQKLDDKKADWVVVIHSEGCHNSILIVNTPIAWFQ